MNEINSTNYIVSNNKYIWLWVIQSFTLILLVPCLEYPDASAHFPKVFNEDITSYYFRFLHEIVESIFSDFDKSILFNGNTQYGIDIWRNKWIHSPYYIDLVILLQIINILICALSIVLFNWLVLRNKKLNNNEKNLFAKMNLLYYFLPSTSYLILGTTPDFAVYLFQPYFIYLLYQNKIVLCLLFSILLRHEDRSATINIFLCIVYILFLIFQRIKIKTQHKILFITTITIVLCFIIRNSYLNYLFIGFEPGEIMIYMQANERRMRLWTKFINIIITSSGMWGTNYITFPLIYIIWIILLMKIYTRWFKDKIRNLKFDFIMLSSTIITVGLILILPPYSHIRFFMFMLLLIIWGTFIYIFRDSYILNNKKFRLCINVLCIHNILLGLSIWIYNILFY
jgi:hypothetical protein